MRAFWKGERRVAMSANDFRVFIEGLSGDKGLFDLYDLLIADNPRVNRLDSDSWRLTKGQKILYRLAHFHYEVRNGGVEQFLWNRPWQVFDVQDHLETLQQVELLELLEPLLEVVGDAKSDWSQLRAKPIESEDQAYEAFTRSKGLLGESQFNDCYFGRGSPGDQHHEPGLGDALTKALLAFVLENPREYVRGA